MKIQVTEMVSQTFTLEVPDTLTTEEEIDAEVERQRTQREDIKRDVAVSGVEWGHKIESSEDVVKSLELFSPTWLYIPLSAMDTWERNIWVAYMNNMLVVGIRLYSYQTWREAGIPMHSPAAVLEHILKQRGE